MTIPIHAILTCHVATLDDDVSPARPLSALIAGGVYPFALPGNAMLLVLTACDAPLWRSSDPGEDRILAAGDEPATRTALADLVEQRGDIARAEALRDRELGPALVAEPAAMFHHVHAIAMYRGDDHPDPPRAADAPAMQLEVAGRRYRLGPATAIDENLARVPLTDGVRGVHLVHAGGVVLVSRHGGVQLSINGQDILLDVPRALFDGDELELTARTRKLVATVRTAR